MPVEHGAHEPLLARAERLVPEVPLQRDQQIVHEILSSRVRGFAPQEWKVEFNLLEGLGSDAIRTAVRGQQDAANALRIVYVAGRPGSTRGVLHSTSPVCNSSAALERSVFVGSLREVRANCAV